ncbi:MAG: NifB/NifX family molybdenum-iron cluster-binding protein [bacterium]|nr:hypothetical protein [Candidatus Margulisiibacteriota bacterium]
MRICLPVQEYDGLKSEISDHFGLAPLFLIYDEASGSQEKVLNSDQGHGPDQCKPLEDLKIKPYNCVICKAIGERAWKRLHLRGIKVLETTAKTVEQAIANFKAGGRREISFCQNCKKRKAD